MDDTTLSEPTKAARLCAIAVALWMQWAEHYDLPRDLLVVESDEKTIDLLRASEKALAAFRAQHGKPGIETSRN
jgi:hypothetical protein